jgi:hypothetical protein
MILEKLEESFEQSEFVCHSQVDFDLESYEIIVGHVGVDGELLRYTKFERENYTLQQLKTKLEQTELAQLDLDYRLCKLELGI